MFQFCVKCYLELLFLSFGNIELSSVSNQTNGDGKALAVEQCSCSEEYDGLSCEVNLF